MPGVSLLGMELKFPRSGEKWAWHWLFPAPRLSIDPESGIERRHHLHADVYAAAFKRAAEAAVENKRVTTHAFRHVYSYYYICWRMFILKGIRLVGDRFFGVGGLVALR